jgi:hypothetical protein
MNHHSLINTAILAGSLALGTLGCNRNDPILETQTTSGVQPRMEAADVSGCLRAGNAENTFVLTATEAGGAGETATYQLTGHDVNLRDYVGQQVQVSGTLRSEQQVASSGAAVVDEAKGTSGTPTVETKTELNVKEMTVSAVKASGERCAPELPKEDQPERRIN